MYDCPQVTVSVNSIATGFAATASLGDAVGNCPPGWNAIFEAAIVRGAAEAPQGRRGQVAPAVADIEIDAAQSDADATVLTRAVELVAGPGWSQYGNVPAALQFGEVAGGLTAVVLTVTLNLWDFPPDPNAPPEPEPSP